MCKKTYLDQCNMINKVFLLLLKAYISYIRKTCETVTDCNIYYNISSD